MSKIFTLIVYILVATALFNQINAQVPFVNRNAEMVSYANNLEADYSLVGLDFHSIRNKQMLEQPKLKAAQAELELLDSIVYLETYEGTIYNGDKKVWEYDADGNNTFFSWYYWGTAAETWMGRQRLDSIFDANGQLSMIIKDRWDSETLQWKTGNKTVLSYNSNGDLILYADYSWNADTEEWEWEMKQESIHTYTEDNERVTVSVTYNYNNETGEWTPHHRNELNYDSNGKMTLYNASFFDNASNNWIFRNGSFLYEYTYDVNGNQILSSYYVWNSELNQWKGQGDLHESGYDSNGNRTTHIIKKWDVSLNQWVNYNKSDYVYNEHWLIAQYIFYLWDSSTDVWVAKNQTENSFNENGDVTGIIESEWDNENGLWVANSKQEYSYDTFGNLSQFIVLQADTASNEWHAKTKDEYTYDVFNKEIMKESFKLNDEGGLYVYRKKETAYDAYGNVVFMAVYVFDEQSGDFIKSEDSKFTYNESGDKLIEEATSIYFDGIPFVLKSNYYYSIHSVISSVDKNINIETEAPLVYPNPFTDQISFKLNNNNNRVTLELFNSQGLKVLSKSVQDSETINVVNFPRGVYFYTLPFENKIHRGKLIKK